MTYRSILLGAVLIAAAPALAAAPSAAILKAVADPGRPPADTARDAARKPAEMLAFAAIKPGQTVADIAPGGGYFTRLFSTAVGPKGKVYAVGFKYVFAKMPPSPGPARTPPPPVSSEPGHGNVIDVELSEASLGVPVPLDVAWTAENYHDLHVFLGPEGAAAFNKAVFAALKPGGVFVIDDHAASTGIDEAGIKALHRIDAETVKREVIAAGFVLDGESLAMRNPADPHTAGIRDPSIRGHTDQFVLRFRKPR